MISPEDFDDLVMELEKLLKYEEESIVRVRKVEADIKQFLKTRDMEFLESKLIVSPFDRHRNVEAKEGIKELVKYLLRSTMESIIVDDFFFFF